MEKIINFDDKEGWLDTRIQGVKKAYYIPNCFDGDGVCLDIGSNVGAFPIVNSHRFKKIICFEPAHNTYLRLVENTKLFDNVETHNIAVTDKDDDIVKLKECIGNNFSGNASIINHKGWDDDNYELIKTISLDTLLKKYNFNNTLNYIKIDAESSEYFILMNKDLSDINYLSLEIHIHLGVEKVQELKNHIEKYFDILKIKGGGNVHYEITYINKNMQ